MDIADHFHIILRQWWRIGAAALVIALLVFAWRRSVPEEYASTALLRVVVQDQQGSNANEENVSFAGRSYALLAKARPVLKDAAARLKDGTKPDEIGSSVSVDAETTGYLSVRAVTGDPGQSARTATAVAAALMSAVHDQEVSQQSALLAPVQAQMTDLEKELATLSSSDPRRSAAEAQYQALAQSTVQTSLRPLDRLDLVASAQSNSTPVSPHPRRDAFLAFVLALIVNAELAVVLSVLGDRFPMDDLAASVTDATGLPVLGEIPEADEAGVVEAMRSLRTNLAFMEVLESIRSVAVVGGETGCGKSFVTVHLAVSIGELEIPVKLVDADVRHPSLHTYLGVPRSPGMTDAVQHGAKWSAVTMVPDRPGLRFLPAGSGIARDPAGLFASSAFKNEVLRDTDGASLVLVDTPPLGLFADALAVAGQCDGVLFVLDATRSRRRRVKRSLRLLEQLGIRPIGIVINRSRAERIRGYYRNTPVGARSTPAPTGLGTPARPHP